MPPDEPKPRQPSRPDVYVGVEQPEKRAVRNHPGLDGADQPAPARRGTMPGGMSAIPQPPALPGELSPTVKAPPRPPLKQTRRVPTPPSAVAAARRTDPPAALETDSPGTRAPTDQTGSGGHPAASLPPPSQSPERARIAAQDRELDRLRLENAQLERDKRAAADARTTTGRFPPTTTGAPRRSISPVPESRPSRPPDRGAWQKLWFKLATALVAALVLVIAALGYWGVTAIEAKRGAIKDAQAAKKQADEREQQWRQWANVVTYTEDCRDRRDVESGEMLRPDPQKMGAARRLTAWRNECPPQLPPAP